ncbi:XisI protein [Aphanothece sacrum]|uniref:XisI-like fdxN element excision controlling factor protein n=1 Tax=Aphanothece sacrum FPU1 TaxID=1920663 RepID=A0A401IGN8_APHSA|nr:XisI protein [Aphanothece sacrum]GBF80452.1 XisI-like fdxN element excision controlling factor protein [Aphanothece sacrum FPU1]GBF85533.1 XisI-like fdxN element excision controlling factor protein [Aphanothece sacrum FPU3]
METLTYKQLIQDIIQNYADKHPQNQPIETQIVFDPQNHHYLLLYVGWEGEKQIYGCPIHVDIKDNKFWIQRDFTEEGIASQLLEAGVSKENIVLGFRSPFNRQFTDFAAS